MIVQYISNGTIVFESENQSWVPIIGALVDLTPKNQETLVRQNEYHHYVKNIIYKPALNTIVIDLEWVGLS